MYGCLRDILIQGWLTFRIFHYWRQVFVLLPHREGVMRRIPWGNEGALLNVSVLLNLRAHNALLDVLVRVQLGQPQHLLINVNLSLSDVGAVDYIHLNSIDLLLDWIQLENWLMTDWLKQWQQQLPPVEDSLDDSREGWWYHLIVIELDLYLRDPHDFCIPTCVGARLMQ